MAKIKNLSDAVVNVGAVSIRPGVTAVVDNWNVHRHSDQALALLRANAIEVVEEKAEEPKSEPRKSKAKKEPADVVHLTDDSDV